MRNGYCEFGPKVLKTRGINRKRRRRALAGKRTGRSVKRAAGPKLIPGPYDLSKFMNVQFGGEEHEAAIARVLKAAHDAGKTAAIFCELAFPPPT